MHGTSDIGPDTRAHSFTNREPHSNADCVSYSEPNGLAHGVTHRRTHALSDARSVSLAYRLSDAVAHPLSQRNSYFSTNSNTDLCADRIAHAHTHGSTDIVSNTILPRPAARSAQLPQRCTSHRVRLRWVSRVCKQNLPSAL